MSRLGSQQRVILEVLGRLRPFWRSDRALGSRIEAVLRADRRFGSRDRRLYRELAYATLRYLPWIEPLLDSDPGRAALRAAWLAAPTRETAALRAAAAAALGPCPDGADAKARVLGEDAGALSPPWLARECPEALEPPLRDCLLSRAPLWLRLQADEEDVLAEFGRLGWSWRRSAFAPAAVGLPPGTDVLRTQAYARGRVEVQDVGSQRVLLSAGIGPGGAWLDACAGAGGKTLQLASLLGPGGTVTARDPRADALRELDERARRAGLSPRIRIGAAGDPDGGYDGVLVDAPCSGSGTWRRAPHLRWTTDARGLGDFARGQLAILRANAARPRAGGLLVYATCSLCRRENEDVVREFLEGEPAFRLESSPLRLPADEHDGDGFFVAVFRRRA